MLQINIRYTSETEEEASEWGIIDHFLGAMYWAYVYT